MKTKKIILLFSIICAVMLLNISITNQGIFKLNVKVASLKEAQADIIPENAFNVWSLYGQGDPYYAYWAPLCELRYGYFSQPTGCPVGW